MSSDFFPVLASLGADLEGEGLVLGIGEPGDDYPEYRLIDFEELERLRDELSLLTSPEYRSRVESLVSPFRSKLPFPEGDWVLSIFVQNGEIDTVRLERGRIEEASKGKTSFRLGSTSLSAIFLGEAVADFFFTPEKTERITRFIALVASLENEVGFSTAVYLNVRPGRGLSFLWVGVASIEEEVNTGCFLFSVWKGYGKSYVGQGDAVEFDEALRLLTQEVRSFVKASSDLPEACPEGDDR